jgi:quercetin dioxygenase-like cupin family protein
MIIKNYHESDHELVVSHEGKGTVANVTLFRSEDLNTNLRFLIYTELKPGTSISYHQHGKDEAVYVVLKGSGLITVNGQSRNVKEGGVVLNKPGWSHGLENNSQENLQILVFEVAQ